MHKAPQLDLVGWFTLGSADGPKPYHLPIHDYMASFNEAAVILLFDARSVAEGSVTGGKLPLRVYEGIWEPTGGGGGGGARGGKTGAENADEEMTDDGSEQQQQQQQMRFRELSHSIETGGAEMIAVDFVAKGGARANTAARSASSAASGKEKGKGKGKALAAEDPSNQDNAEISLAPDEEECKLMVVTGRLVRAFTCTYRANIGSDILLDRKDQRHQNASQPSEAHICLSILHPALLSHIFHDCQQRWL